VMDSTSSNTAVKPKKPYPDFPLHAYASGGRAKKISQKLHYFSSWRDPNATVLTCFRETGPLNVRKSRWISVLQNEEILEMKKSRFTNEQIAFGLREVESGTPIKEVCRKLGISNRRSIGGRRSCRDGC
jgi:hypothetical protein